MRKMSIVLAFMLGLVLAGPAVAEVFTIGPAMLGHPGDDPSVGYSALELDLKAGILEGGPIDGMTDLSQRPWEESWYQSNLFAGV